MGVVYRARHKGLKRHVALKMILSGPMATDEERQRFLREAELAANLDHPNIVPIYEVGEHDDRPYFCMKLVEGESLSRARPAGSGRSPRRRPSGLDPGPRRALRPRTGFLHCDLKPSNVLLDGQGRPYLTDFGLARRAGEDSSLSISGAILGTPSYMAPEQATGSRAGSAPPPTCMAWAHPLRAAHRPAPFRSPTIMETVVQVLERDPAPPRRAPPGDPPGTGEHLPQVPGEVPEGPISDRRGPRPRAGQLPPGRRHRGRPASSRGSDAGTAASPSWSPGWAAWA